MAGDERVKSTKSTREERVAQTEATCRAILATEAKLRVEKTRKLRAMRLALTGRPQEQ